MEQVIGYNSLLKPITVERLRTASLEYSESKMLEGDMEHSFYLFEMYLCQQLQRRAKGLMCDTKAEVEKALNFFGLSFYTADGSEDRVVFYDRAKNTYKWRVRISDNERIKYTTVTVHPSSVVVKTEKKVNKNRHRRSWSELPPEIQEKIKIKNGWD